MELSVILLSLKWLKDDSWYSRKNYYELFFIQVWTSPVWEIQMKVKDK